MKYKSNLKIVLTGIFIYSVVNSFAQPKALTSSEIFQNLKKLNTVGSALYVAAHPDDENTLLIGYLSKEKMVQTGYMALTRGDGGQNLIGPEQNEYVGLLRTHELLEARKIDGGEQYFSRAVDFGFTKQTDEALSTWNKDKILEDLVYRIRKFKPDVIINRFPPDNRAGHGHHSASAQLSIEAFDAAADPNKFPLQLTSVQTWQAKRLLWNTYNRGFTGGAPEEGSFIKIPLGEFNPLLGKSYPEIAAEARSKHRSQGFGSAPSRNERFDYGLHIKGEKAENDIFDGVDLSWSRVEGGQKIKVLTEELIKNYDFKNPSNSVPALLIVLKNLEELNDVRFKENKIEECKQLIFNCAGIYLEANTQNNYAVPGEQAKVFFTAIKRSNVDLKVEKVGIMGIAKKDTVLNANLLNNKSMDVSLDVIIPSNSPISQPYWLWKKAEKGLYLIDKPENTGLPMSNNPLFAIFEISINGKQVSYSHPIRYKFTEPSRGEIYKYFEVRPPFTINIDQKNLLFTDTKAQKVTLTAKNYSANTTPANVGLQVPAGWTYSPKMIEVTFGAKNTEKKVEFEITAPNIASEGELKAFVEQKDQRYDRGIKTVNYEHIPELNVFPEASSHIKKIDLKIKGKNIAYIAGAGDEVPDALKQIGYNLVFLDEKTIRTDLNKFDAIIIGVRAYNTEDWLVSAQGLLLNYVKNGGTMVVQYQTQAFYGTVKTQEMGPYPLAIGRGRVTDENAQMRILNTNDPILNTPNKITEDDFKHWVQERGLYFAEKWGPEYKTVFAIKDQGENEQEGSLLYTKYGKGQYVFTSLAFFRQLPSGVTGAFRLMANIISIGKK